ncbi:MAG: redox-active rane protein, partial [Deltaproteobacteria bacterium]|nr:redox-active rane protein [Deltaproteobacteria bacterium]
ERQGRILKLISGLMMLGLGLALLINPALLNNPLASVGLLLGTLALAALIVFAAGRTGHGQNEKT